MESVAYDGVVWGDMNSKSDREDQKNNCACLDDQDHNDSTRDGQGENEDFLEEEDLLPVILQSSAPNLRVCHRYLDDTSKPASKKTPLSCVRRYFGKFLPTRVKVLNGAKNELMDCFPTSGSTTWLGPEHM